MPLPPPSLQPFILEHLDDIARCLSHPAVFAYLHVPVGDWPSTLE